MLVTAKTTPGMAKQNDNLSHHDFGDNTSGLGEYNPTIDAKKPLSDC